MIDLVLLLLRDHLRKECKMDIQEEIKEFCQYYSQSDSNLFVQRLKEGGLSDKMIIVVLDSVVGVCKYCFDSDNPCYCMRDD